MFLNNNYYDDVFLQHEPYFYELVEKVGKNKVFEKTEVDGTTQDNIIDFFQFDRLCDTENKFLWLFARRLNQYYPLYKDQMESYAERKTMTWFFDNYKTEERQHDGTFKLDEETERELKRTLDRVMKDIYSGTDHTETETNGTRTQTTGENTTTTGQRDQTSKNDETTSGTSHTEREDEHTNDTDTKGRSFGFAYPESNYSGGVIPYDLDNNPSVEFISTQGDTLSKSHEEYTGSSEEDTTTSGEKHGTGEQHETTGGTGTKSGTLSEVTHGTGATDGTHGHTDDQTTNDEENTGETVGHGQDTETHWTETVRRQGDNINALLKDIIETIPTTDFFRQFMDMLKPCFQSIYLVDEELEERGIM